MGHGVNLVLALEYLGVDTWEEWAAALSSGRKLWDLESRNVLGAFNLITDQIRC